MKAAEERDSYDLAERLGWSAERGVLIEHEMGPGAIVIFSVFPEYPSKMRLAQDHDVIEALASDRADEPLDVSVLPRRTGCGWSIADAPRLDSVSDDGAVRGVKSGLGWYLQWAQGWAAYANMYGALLVMALMCSTLITPHRASYGSVGRSASRVVPRSAALRQTLRSVVQSRSSRPGRSRRGM
jgi:hypothetical protein